MIDTIDFKVLEFAIKNKNFIAETIAQTREDFYSADVRVAMKILRDYYNENKDVPSYEMACEYADSYPSPNQAKEVLYAAYSTDKTKLTDGDFPELVKQVKRKYNDAYIRERVKHITNCFNDKYDIDDINEKIKKITLEISTLKDNQTYSQGAFGDSAKQDYLDYLRIKENPELAKGVMSGFKDLDALTNGFRGSELIVVSGASGCHAKGQGILMYDGTIKKVEDIIIGEQLMGPDSKPRNVLQLCHGFDDMVEIIPTKGKSFIVNKDHILSLQRIRKYSHNHRKTDNLAGKITDVKVRDYVKWTNNQKILHKLFRTGIEFYNKEEMPLNPYFLGLLLGDGSLKNNSLSITTMDKEIKAEIYQQAANLGLRITEQQKKTTRAISYYFVQAGENSWKHDSHTLRNLLEQLNLMGTNSGNKFIPYEYKVSTKENRLEILAGLIDTDGSLSGNGYDFISKSEQLSNDVAYLSRSLGLAAYINPCHKSDQNGTIGLYYRVSISGDTNIIPCRIKRKKATIREQKKSVLRTGFEIKELNRKENYFGFILDGDHRYLLDDFTVTHNSGKSICLMNMAMNAWLGNNKPTTPENEWDDSGKNVWFVTIENSMELQRRRMMSRLAAVSCNGLRDGKLDGSAEQQYLAATKFRYKYSKKKTFYVSDLGKNITMAVIEAEYEKILQHFKPDIIVIDYLGKMRAINPTGQDWMDMGSVALDMYEFTKIIKDTPVLTATQMKAGMRTNTGIKRFEGDVENISRSKMIGDNISMNLQIVKDENYDLSSYMTLVVSKSRDGETGGKITLCREFWRMTVCDMPDTLISK